MNREEGRRRLIASLGLLARSFEAGLGPASGYRGFMRALRCVPRWLLDEHEGAVAQVLMLAHRDGRTEDALEGSLHVLGFYVNRDPDSENVKVWITNVRWLLEEAGEDPTDEEIRRRAREAVDATREDAPLSTEAFAQAPPTDLLDRAPAQPVQTAIDQDDPDAAAPASYEGPAKFEIERDADGVLVLRLFGDMKEGEVLFGALEAARAQKLDRILVDLRKLTWGAAALTGVIAATFTAAKEQGGHLVVFGAPDFYRHQLKVNGIDQHISIHEDLESARGELDT